MDNLAIYNKVREVPANALKEIGAGRLKGKSDINPMWRIKVLTETFGMCGFGWKYEITNKRLEQGGNNEISAFVDINLYVNDDGEWSAPIPGTGGSAFVANERNGLYTSDECFKMALTDAISVACKALGVGADVYWGSDNTKYNKHGNNSNTLSNVSNFSLTDKQIARLNAIAKAAGKTHDDVKQWVKVKFGKESTKELTKTEYDEVCTALENLVKEAK